MVSQTVYVALALALMVSVLIFSFTLARRSNTITAKVLLELLGLVSIIFVVGLSQNIAIRESFAGRLPSSVGEFFISTGQLILALTAQAVLITMFFIRRRHRSSVLTELAFLECAVTDFPVVRSLDDYALSSRERDVLTAMFQGSLTDAELSDALYVSRATAATHIRNILRKTELHHRRDLLLLPQPTHGVAA